MNKNITNTILIALLFITLIYSNKYSKIEIQERSTLQHTTNILPVCLFYITVCASEEKLTTIINSTKRPISKTFLQENSYEYFLKEINLSKNL